MTYKIGLVLIKYTEYKSFIKWLNKDFRPALQITTQHEQDITKKLGKLFRLSGIILKSKLILQVNHTSAVYQNTALRQEWKLSK